LDLGQEVFQEGRVHLSQEQISARKVFAKLTLETEIISLKDQLDFYIHQ